MLPKCLNFRATLILRSLLLGALLCSANMPVRAQDGSGENVKPVVLATIKPIQLVLAAIGGSYVQADALLPPLVSPHLYQLKPSDRQRLEDAALLVWVGPEMERFLVKPLSLKDGSRILQLLEANNEHDQGDSALTGSSSGHAFPDHDSHQHSKDPHIWLSPERVLHIAELVAKRLSVLLPQHQQAFVDNLATFKQQLTAVDQQLQQQFGAIQPKPYMVLHDGYQHFENHYGLKHAAALTLSPDRKPGARKVWQVKSQIDKGEISCVFTEPQYQPAILRSLVGDTNVSIQLLDPMAMKIDVNELAYIAFLKEFGESFLSCIQ